MLLRMKRLSSSRTSLPIVAETFPANTAAIVVILQPIVDSLDNPAMGRLKLRLFAAGSVVNLFELGISTDQLSPLVSFVIASAPTLDDFHLFVLGEGDRSSGKVHAAGRREYAV
jgi:hypothetical protein